VRYVRASRAKCTARGAILRGGGALSKVLISYPKSLSPIPALGLDPGIGVLHVDTKNRDSLACDLMEAVRPQVDAWVLDWISREPLAREWFFEQRDGNCRLMASFAARLSETAPTWGRLIAPFAEWVAQTLWNRTRNATREGQIPTRLTQRRKTEGRGRTFAPKQVSITTPLKVCSICGVEIASGKYCSACVAIPSRENMTLAAFKWHSIPQNTRAKKRAAQLQSDHAVAISWWSPSNLPPWLNENCYVEKIQPRLRTVKVREVAQALHISKPYAALVRAGRRRPHPRHWLALAELVGASRG